MFTSRNITLTALLAFTFLLTSCSSNNNSSAAETKTPSTAAAPAPKPSTPSIPDPCTLLTQDEAAAIVGETVKDPEPSALFGNRICDWSSVKLHGGIAPYTVHIALAPESRQSWDQGKKIHTGKEWQPVAGIGEDAAFELDDLVVYSKGFSININVLKEIDKPDHMKVVQESEKAVAAKALPRL